MTERLLGFFEGAARRAIEQLDEFRAAPRRTLARLIAIFIVFVLPLLLGFKFVLYRLSDFDFGWRAITGQYAEVKKNIRTEISLNEAEPLFGEISHDRSVVQFVIPLSLFFLPPYPMAGNSAIAASILSCGYAKSWRSPAK